MQLYRGVTAVNDELRNRTLRYTLRTLRFCRDLLDNWEAREPGRALLRASLSVSSQHWSACRGSSFMTKMAAASDAAADSALLLMLIVQSGLRQDADAKDLLAEAREITAVL